MDAAVAKPIAGGEALDHRRRVVDAAVPVEINDGGFERAVGTPGSDSQEAHGFTSYSYPTLEQDIELSGRRHHRVGSLAEQSSLSNETHHEDHALTHGTIPWP